MKHLRVEVNGIEYVNGDFTEISFTDGPTGVRVEGKVKTAATGGGSLATTHFVIDVSGYYL